MVSSPAEVLYLLLTFFEREGKSHSFDGFIGESVDNISRTREFFEERLCYWFRVIMDIVEENEIVEIHASDLAVLWGILDVYPHICCPNGRPSSITNLIDALMRLLSIDTDSISGLSKSLWQSIAGASLASYHKLLADGNAGHSEISKFLLIAKANKSSPQVLSAVAEFLDFLFGSMSEKGIRQEFPEFGLEHAADAMGIFAENLVTPDKRVRVSSLRILSYFSSLDEEQSTEDQQPSKKLKTEGSGPVFVDSQDTNVILLLLSIETTPLTVSTSRKIVMLISRMQMNATAGKISDAYIPVLYNGLIGIFHNPFGYLWQPTIECLTALIGKHKDLIWNRCVQCFEHFQLEFLSSGCKQDIMTIECPNSNGIGHYFQSHVHLV